MVHPTVQHSVETALKNIYKLEGERPIIVRFCSRTDSGVHALKAALHVDLPQFQAFNFLSPIAIKSKLNQQFFGSCNIRVLDVIQVPDSFHVSKACLSKTYIYRVGVLKEEFHRKHKSNLIDFPITEFDRTYFLKEKVFDLRKAEEVTPLFLGEKDFVALGRKPKINIRPTICNILSFTIEKAQPQMPFDCENSKFDYYHFICKGTRFLYHMVRSMVGAVLSVGIGRTSFDEIKMLFDKPEPSSWLSKIFVVPGCGLYLADTSIDPQKLIMEKKKESGTNNGFQKTTSSEVTNSAEQA